MPELPSGTVTFLFTDLEDSTRLWQEHPDAMRGALARHDALVRGAIESHDGRVVKTTGDGFHAVFADAVAGVEAAIATQRAVGAESWESTGALRIRVGLHTGPAELRDGDYYGTAVNRAARLMSCAHGGQIVVSLATEELVADSGIELLDLGDHQLKGLARADRVFQVLADGLGRDFPRLQSLDASPGNLPAQSTSFVGRDRELAAVVDALAGCRLVTLTGVGGVGKTRLSLEAAAEIAADFPDGAWCCELAAASDAESLAQVIASSLGITPIAGMSLDRSIVESLHRRSQLVVLDNCEHLLDEVSAIVEPILRECPHVRLLATSREGLGVPGEQMLAVRSLAPPAAVELFVARGASARAGFADDAANADAIADAIAEICRRLDGIPLAVELAAARVATMNPVDIAQHIDERFRLLTGGRRTGIERHQTLRATVDWSYSLLEPPERAVFDRLGVFAGGFDAANAVAVAWGDGVEAWDVHDALTSLVAKSMVTLDARADGEARYSMLETLRTYALERLDERDETDVWRRRHAERYAELAGQWAVTLLGPDELVHRRRLRTEIDNVRTAVTWALERDDPEDQELAVRIIVCLCYEVTLDRSNNYGSWAEDALDRVVRWSPALHSAILGASTQAALHRGDFETALARAELALTEMVPGAIGCLMVPIGLASTLNFVGRADEAVTTMERARELFDTPGTSAYEKWNIVAVLAVFRATSGDLDRARVDAEESLRLARALRNPSAMAIALGARALAVLAEDPAAALAAAEECVDLVESGASDVMYTISCSVAAAAATVLDDRRRALELVVAGLRHSFEQRDVGSMNFAVSVGVGSLLAASGPELAVAASGALTRIASGDEFNRAARQHAEERALRSLDADRYARERDEIAGWEYDQIVERILAALEREVDRFDG